jgi:hypothetical protein
VSVLPRTRRRSIHDSRNLSRALAASLRDRLRRPLTEPACRTARQLSGSGEGPGTGPGADALPETGREMAARTRTSRCWRPGDRGDGERDQWPTAAANRYQQRPATAHNARTIAPTGDMFGLISGRSEGSTEHDPEYARNEPGGAGPTATEYKQLDRTDSRDGVGSLRSRDPCG